MEITAVVFSQRALIKQDPNRSDRATREERMSVRKSVCPKCGGALDVKDVRWDEPFVCPNCHRELRVSTIYYPVYIICSVAAALVICSSLNLRGDHWGIAFVVLLWPCMLSVALLMRFAVRPKIVACEDDPSPFSSTLFK
jgi:hypothetical protein